MRFKISRAIDYLLLPVFTIDQYWTAFVFRTPEAMSASTDWWKEHRPGVIEIWHRRGLR